MKRICNFFSKHEVGIWAFALTAFNFLFTVNDDALELFLLFVNMILVCMWIFGEED